LISSKAYHPLQRITPTGEDPLCPHSRSPPFDFKTQYGLGFNPQDNEIVVDFFLWWRRWRRDKANNVRGALETIGENAGHIKQGLAQLRKLP